MQRVIFCLLVLCSTVMAQASLAHPQRIKVIALEPEDVARVVASWRAFQIAEANYQMLVDMAEKKYLPTLRAERTAKTSKNASVTLAILTASSNDVPFDWSEDFAYALVKQEDDWKVIPLDKQDVSALAGRYQVYLQAFEGWLACKKRIGEQYWRREWESQMASRRKLFEDLKIAGSGTALSSSWSGVSSQPLEDSFEFSDDFKYILPACRWGSVFISG